MADNQFSVAVPNILQALTAGGEGYKEVSGMIRENRINTTREAAAKSIMEGGSPQTALAQLISIGDDKGAQTLANLVHNQQTADYQNKSLAATEKFHAGTLAQQGRSLEETGRHNRALEAASSEAQNKPMVLPPGSGLVDRQGNVLREPTADGLLDPETVTAMAHQLKAGDTSVLTNLGRGAQGAQNVIAVRKKLAEINAGQGEVGAEQANRNAEFFGAKAGQRTLGARSANIELAATEFKQILPVVMDASNAVNRTNYPDLNKIIQSFETRTGDPNIVKFGGGVNTLINIYARAISPSGVPTVSDKDHAREILSKAWSQGQFNAATGMMQQEIDAALSSPEKVRDDMRRRFIGGQSGSSPAPASPASPGGQTQTGVQWRIVQ